MFETMRESVDILVFETVANNLGWLIQYGDCKKPDNAQRSDICICRAELNSGIKFDKGTTEARRLNQTFELSSASNRVWPGSFVFLPRAK